MTPQAAAEPGLRLTGVVLSLDGRRLFRPLTFDVPPGEVVTVMGPSGSGKSSLLALICGTLEPAFAVEGSVAVDRRPLDGLPPERRGVGILFQDDLLFPHLTVGENLSFALPASVGGRAERARRIADALAEADLAGFESRAPTTLSGGQRTRAALMRTLLAGPRVLLLDEPFARLDRPLRARMRRFVFDHARRRGLPILLVTHDAEDAEAAGGRVIHLDAPPAPEPSGVSA